MGCAYREFRAKVRLLSTDEGGRELPLNFSRPGALYRPLADLGLGYTDGLKNYAEAQVISDVPGLIEPGTERVLTVGLQYPEECVSLEPGIQFDLCEGKRVVAKAEVIELLG